MLAACILGQSKQFDFSSAPPSIHKQRQHINPVVTHYNHLWFVFTFIWIVLGYYSSFVSRTVMTFRIILQPTPPCRSSKTFDLIWWAVASCRMQSPVSNWWNIVLNLPKDDPAWSRSEEEDRAAFQPWLHMIALGAVGIDGIVCWVSLLCSFLEIVRSFLQIAMSPTERPKMLWRSQIGGRKPSKLLVKAHWNHWLQCLDDLPFFRSPCLTLSRGAPLTDETLWHYVLKCFKVSSISLHEHVLNVFSSREWT